MEANTIDVDSVTVVDGAEELANKSGLSLEASIKLVDIMDFRARNRSDGTGEVLIKVDDEYSEWALEAESAFMIVGEIEDYVNKFGENKSYKVWGAATVNEVVFDDESERPSISQAVTTVDETDKEFISERGQTWVAKQYVENIYVLA